MSTTKTHGAPSLGPESWQYKAVAMTKGNQTKLGTFVLAVINKPPKNPPRIMGALTIERDGSVFVPFQAKDGTISLRAPFCFVDEIISNMRGLADACKFTDEEREEMAGAIRKLIRVDKRIAPPAADTGFYYDVDG